jgi:hypothetical protein
VWVFWLFFFFFFFFFGVLVFYLFPSHIFMLMCFGLDKNPIKLIWPT